MLDKKLLKYIKGQSSPDEKQEIEDWLKMSSSNLNHLSRLKKQYEQDEYFAHMITFDIDAAYKKVNRRLWLSLSKDRIRQFRYVAAVLIIALISGVIYNFLFTSQDKLITLESNGNKNITYTFSDGSKVILNRNSKIIFPETFSSHERRVELEGEAYFEVTKDRDNKPFLVQTKDQFEIKVLGTKFNVQAYLCDSIIEASLYEGSISVKKDQSYLKAHLLSPSERFIVNKKTGLVNLSRTSKYNTADWMHDRQVFDDTTLPEVMRVLSHQFNVDVEMYGDILSAYNFTGTFENRTLHQILKYIQISSNINFKIEKQKNGKDLVTISSAS